MKAQTFRARSDERGRLLMAPDQRRGYEMCIAAHAGHVIEVTVKRFRKKRSLPQNARYWALLTVAADSLWGDRSQKDELHEDLAHGYFGLPPDPKTGGRRRRRTPDTETDEFGQYMNWCVDTVIRFGADLSDWEEETRRMAA